ncbi:uncharacterized protein LOC108208690 isoform X2 [Daucus carota subsp. sativus]|uniref:uncharacterized protein LOC108208690 isoform X2 n=1 Tax=Daucus carota subsp. sativus TaxID=79200 RepID=UPI0007EFB2A2|nr:PREDICTED: uncharacterized protein LOC108208690 isoform X2 [Daucus carota subsp. sativus]
MFSCQYSWRRENRRFKGSSHCRRRRKLPPWMGSPSMVQALPENRRYVCIACSFTDSGHLSEQHLHESAEVGEALIDKGMQSGKPPKCSIVIVDSYSLTIVQTVFHGNLSIGSLKFMSVILPVGDIETQSVMMIDSEGKTEFLSLLKDSDLNGENPTILQRNSLGTELGDLVNESNEGGLVISFATVRQVVALVYKTYCVFRLVNGTIVGKVSFLDSQLCVGGSGNLSHVIGCMFLEHDEAGAKAYSEDSENIFVETFAVWNNRGCAILYDVSYLSNIFKFEPVSLIPAVSHQADMTLKLSYLQLHSYLLRIESVCCQMEEPLPWTPHVTVWLLPQKRDKRGNCCECEMIGRGSFLESWVISSSSSHRTVGLKNDSGMNGIGQETILTSLNTCNPCPITADVVPLSDGSYCHYPEKSLVSSSIVISENCHAPYAIVYGFYNGEIEVLQFDEFFGGLDAYGSPRNKSYLHGSKQYLSGHTGAILCLAAHRMTSISDRLNYSHVLMSGSMDCTVHIWDLDSSNLIIVMHQHVAPVCQIILPPPLTDRPWIDCFLSIGEDSCVALASLETLRVERMFPGNQPCPSNVLWDTMKGYVACLCLSHRRPADGIDSLYVWDMKTGARERVLRGTAALSMFDHFCSSTDVNSLSFAAINSCTPASSSHYPLAAVAPFSQSHLKNSRKGVPSSQFSPANMKMDEPRTSQIHASKRDVANIYSSRVLTDQSKKTAVKCSCPFPGIATLGFDLGMLMSLSHISESSEAASDISEKRRVENIGADMPNDVDKRGEYILKKQEAEVQSTQDLAASDDFGIEVTPPFTLGNNSWESTFEKYLLGFSLSFLHLWDVDCELDKLLVTEMKLKRPDGFLVGSGLLGDRGSLTLTFPAHNATLELWKSSSEFCAVRSVTMVSLAQHMVSLSPSCSTASSVLAAFYTRNFAEKIPDIKPPLLQLLVSLWQHKSEHVRMAARSLFHCSASRGIPLPLCREKSNTFATLVRLENDKVNSGTKYSTTDERSTHNLGFDGQPGEEVSPAKESEILAWIETFEEQDWISCVEGTSQDAMTSHIIVAAALACWYPSLVKPNLAMLAVHPLMKLVMAMNEKYSSTAAEILAEGMENTWKACIASEIPCLIGDIYDQIEYLSGTSSNSRPHNPSPSLNIRETLIGVLLPSLAMADVQGFLQVVERQIWSTASDSPIHVVSLVVLTRIVRGSPRNLAQYLDKVINFVLMTMDPANSAMRKICLQTSLVTLKEVVRVYPMVTLNDLSTRLAVGDAFGELNKASIRVYDMNSMAAIKILDASGPPGLPSLLGGDSELSVATAISALSFSPDGEGLVAFSENGLMIRWWSLGSVWWEKLSRNLAPVQYTKLIFVPPWEGFSPNSTRSSIMASVLGNGRHAGSQENARASTETDRLKLLIHNLDLSYRLQWVGERKVLLTQHGRDLGSFQL